MTATVSRDGTPPHDPPTFARALAPATLALAWSLGTAALALAWLLGVVPTPFTDPAWAITGAVLTALDPNLGSGLMLGFGLLAAGCAVAAGREPTGGAQRATRATAWAIPVALVLVVLNGRLLALLGYTPVTLTVGWFVPDMWPSFLAAIVESETLFQLQGLTGALIWAATAARLGRAARGGCGDCGRMSPRPTQQQERSRTRALRIGRRAVAVAIPCILVYPALRLPWLVGVPVGMDAAGWAQLRAEPGMLATGVGLGCAAVVGAVLMLGLVQDWGVRFPRWMVGLSRRRVPISLAVLPAGIVAFAFVAQGRGVILSALFATPVQSMEGTHMVLHVLAFAALLPCGLALAVAAGAYAVRRRVPCPSCERTVPE